MTATARASVRPPEGVARLLAGVDAAPTLDSHLATFGPVDLHADAIRLAADAGLRGRGGAGFPTARKLAAVAEQPGKRVVVGNGAEGEPASKKDRALLRVAPHLVLDGAVLAATAVGAEEIVLAVARPAPELERAVSERARQLPGRITIDVRRVPDRFVTGEETALVRALERRPAKPTLKPPYPFQRGLDGRPTLVQNVETLAHVALIARFGPQWFGGGTALVTLGGAFARVGVHEIPLGSSLADVVRHAGGLASPVAGFLVGGYFGHWVRATDTDTLALTPDVLGAGAIVALPDSTCAAAECARVARYLAGESAGQCGPCVYGLGAIADAVALDNRADRRPDLHRWLGMVEGRGACRHPDGAVRFIRSALEVFDQEFDRHVRKRSCGRSCQDVLPVGGAR